MSIYDPFDKPELASAGLVTGVLMTFFGVFSGLFTREANRQNNIEQRRLKKLDHTRYFLGALQIDLQNCKNPDWSGVTLLDGNESARQ